MPLSVVRLLGASILTKITNPQQRFVKNYTEFHANAKDGRFADTRSQKYGRALRTRRFNS